MSTNWRLWTPLVSGYILSTLCPILSGKGALLKQRPPAYVFGIVWPLLYILVGISWKKSLSDRDTDIMHGILVLLLCLWIIVFSCMGKEKYGLYVLACVVAVTVCCMCLHNDRISKIILTPLLAWTSLALHFNYHIIDRQ